MNMNGIMCEKNQLPWVGGGGVPAPSPWLFLYLESNGVGLMGILAEINGKINLLLHLYMQNFFACVYFIPMISN